MLFYELVDITRNVRPYAALFKRIIYTVNISL